MQNAGVSQHDEIDVQPLTVAHSVRSEVRMHDGTVLDVDAVARRIAGRHKCRWDTLVRCALLKACMRARVVMRL